VLLILPLAGAGLDEVSAVLRKMFARMAGFQHEEFAAGVAQYLGKAWIGLV